MPGCRWHGTGEFAQGPDDLWETSEPMGQALQANENHYAYNNGLTNTSSAKIPLLASGFSNGGTGTYTDDETKPGGVWQGKNCVVIFNDGSGETPKLTDEFKYIDQNGIDVFQRYGQDFVNPQG